MPLQSTIIYFVSFISTYLEQKHSFHNITCHVLEIVKVIGIREWAVKEMQTGVVRKNVSNCVKATTLTHHLNLNYIA